ncbi:hypothetical protein L3Y34_005971 [Caenorhabditis briggsae]|uniref:SPK domain-containing protein n=1 Tax=Caenorhabditis briggsae TaxID=6238 RepID=A0AAE9CWX4_CAEBR|nr:hypothetical protein L3Y34_005971 [Caenorhabditis briggsae]
MKFTRKEVYKMWRFVNKKIRVLSGRPQKKKFESSWADWKQFTGKMGLERSSNSYKRKFSQLEIFKAPFSKRTRLELYYALDAPIPPDFHHLVVRNYSLKLDSEGRLKECDSEKWAEISQSDDEESSSDNEISDPDEEIQKTKDTLSQLSLILKLMKYQIDFWLEFDKTVGPDRSLSTLATHFHLNMS